jgi:transposase
VTFEGCSRSLGLVFHAYHVLLEGIVSCDLGDNSFDERERQAVERRLVHRLHGLGYTVSLTPAV